MKKYTRCNCCHAFGHWADECPHQFQYSRPVRSNFRAHVAETQGSQFSDDHYDYNTFSPIDIFLSTDHHIQPFQFTPDVTSYPTNTSPSPLYYQPDFPPDQTYPSSPEPRDFTDMHEERSFMAILQDHFSDAQDAWIADTGATRHMTDKLAWFVDIKPIPMDQDWSIKAIGGKVCYATGIGTIRILIQLPDSTVTASMNDVLYVPDLQQNLFSTTKVAKQNKLFFSGDDQHCYLRDGNKIVMTGDLKDYIYRLHFSVILPKQTQALSAITPFKDIASDSPPLPLQVWHHRFGHLHYDMIKRMASSGMVKGLNIKGTTTIPSTSVCSGCVFGKLHRYSFPTTSDHPREDRPGVLIHADVCGPMSVTSYGGSKYFILFKDDASCYRFVYCVQDKSEAL